MIALENVESADHLYRRGAVAEEGTDGLVDPRPSEQLAADGVGAQDRAFDRVALGRLRPVPLVGVIRPLGHADGQTCRAGAFQDVSPAVPRRSCDVPSQSRRLQRNAGLLVGNPGETLRIGGREPPLAPSMLRAPGGGDALTELEEAVVHERPPNDRERPRRRGIPDWGLRQLLLVRREARGPWRAANHAFRDHLRLTVWHRERAAVIRHRGEGGFGTILEVE